MHTKALYGEIVLWQGNKLITNDNTYQYIATFYNINFTLEHIFPLKEGFKRRYELVLEYTDNKPRGNVYIRFTEWNNINANAEERLFVNMGGAVKDGTKGVQVLSAPDFSKYVNHTDIYCTPDFATGRTGQNI